jgi:hypothetical protein
MNEKPDESSSNIVNSPIRFQRPWYCKRGRKENCPNALTSLELLAKAGVVSLDYSTYIPQAGIDYLKDEASVQIQLPCGLSVGIKLTVELSFLPPTSEESIDS